MEVTFWILFFELKFGFSLVMVIFGDFHFSILMIIAHDNINLVFWVGLIFFLLSLCITV